MVDEIKQTDLTEIKFLTKTCEVDEELARVLPYEKLGTTIQMMVENADNFSDIESLIIIACDRINLNYQKRDTIAFYKCMLANFYALIWKEQDIVKKSIDEFHHKFNYDNIDHMTRRLLTKYSSYINAIYIEDLFDLDVSMYEYWDLEWYNGIFRKLFEKEVFYEITEYDCVNSVISAEQKAYDRNISNGFTNGHNPSFTMNWRELSSGYSEINLIVESSGYIARDPMSHRTLYQTEDV